jgi:YesN/AraC family two-component response regulator
MKAKFEYYRKGHTVPDSQILSVNSNNHCFTFHIQTFHFAELQPFKPEKKYFEHKHNVFHIVQYTQQSEKNSILVNGAIIKTVPGVIILVPPNIPHSFQAREPGNTAYHELTFSLSTKNFIYAENWSELLAHYSGIGNLEIPTSIMLEYVVQIWFEEIFCELGNILQMPLPSMFSAHSVIAKMFNLLFTQMIQNQTSHGNNLMAQVKLYIEKHYNENINLRELSHRFCISPEHLCRKFTNAYEVPPLMYSMKLRIATAKNLLLYSEFSLKEISNKTGFSNIYAFSKAFKKHTGLAPGEYRKGNVYI